MEIRREVNIYSLMHKLKHIPKSINGITGVSVLGVGLGVAGLYLTLQHGKGKEYSLLCKLDARDSCNHLIPGLRNLGNNCFLNVILQALASCSYYLPFLQNILEDDVLWTEEKAEKMPLLVALTELLEELSIVQHEKKVLNPQNLMHSLSYYVSNFKLARQQDAGEAFLHLLSSIEIEVSDCYIDAPRSLLSEINTLPSRIQIPKTGHKSECKTWRQHIYGPFDGTIGSILTCRTCSSMISVDVEHFCSLALSPVVDFSGFIRGGCSLESCLRKFTAVEGLESYSCSQCWHNAAVKYLSCKSTKNEAAFTKIRNCLMVDSCDCKNVFPQEEFTWSGRSHGLKQLIITHCPKILCIHLQRVSLNIYGELVKLEGHISFPLFLDLSPFIVDGKKFEQETIVRNMQNHRKEQQQPFLGPMNQLNILQQREILSYMCTTAGQEALSGHDISQAYSLDKDQFLKMEETSNSVPCSTSYMYCLSSVVEHYGQSGSGHYAAYRKVIPESSGDISVEPLDRKRHWLYVSDQEVLNVSEETVFAAEASLLFYERCEPHI